VTSDGVSGKPVTPVMRDDKCKPTRQHLRQMISRRVADQYRDGGQQVHFAQVCANLILVRATLVQMGHGGVVAERDAQASER